MNSKAARLLAIVELRKAGYTVSSNAGYRGLARKLGVDITLGSPRTAVKRWAEGSAVEAIIKVKPPAISFYQTREWLELRYKVLKEHGGKCQLCGLSSKDGVRIHVDHIKPKSNWPELALTQSNLQVLCEHCNFGKSNRDATDWRPALKIIKNT